jgi:hypothetical protein
VFKRWQVYSAIRSGHREGDKKWRGTRSRGLLPSKP